MPIRSRLVLPFVVAVLAIGAAAAQDSPERSKSAAERAADATDFDEKASALEQAAREDGTVRVIVRMKPTPDGSRSARRPRPIGEIVDEDAEEGRVVLDLKPDEVRALMRDPTVEHVVPDILLEPHFRESIYWETKAGEFIAETKATGKGVTIAVIDTGVDAGHPALAGKVIGGACFSTARRGVSKSACRKGLAPGSAAQGAPCAKSVTGCDHGTHVASIAAGRANLHFSSIARDAKIYAVQASSIYASQKDCRDRKPPCARFTNNDVAKALKHVLNNAERLKIGVVNLSLGSGARKDGCSIDPDIVSYVRRLNDKGVAVVASTGNDKSDKGIAWPSCVDGVISVASGEGSWFVGPPVAADAEIHKFSNMGTHVDLVANGKAVPGALPGGRYGVKSGTSMAAPIVSGAVALVRSARPKLRPAEIEQILKCGGWDVARKTQAAPLINLQESLIGLRDTKKKSILFDYTLPGNQSDFSRFYPNSGSWHDFGRSLVPAFANRSAHIMRPLCMTDFELSFVVQTESRLESFVLFFALHEKIIADPKFGMPNSGGDGTRHVYFKISTGDDSSAFELTDYGYKNSAQSYDELSWVETNSSIYESGNIANIRIRKYGTKLSVFLNGRRVGSGEVDIVPNKLRIMAAEHGYTTMSINSMKITNLGNR